MDSKRDSEEPSEADIEMPSDDGGGINTMGKSVKAQISNVRSVPPNQEEEDKDKEDLPPDAEQQEAQPAVIPDD